MKEAYEEIKKYNQVPDYIIEVGDRLFSEIVLESGVVKADVAADASEKAKQDAAKNTGLNSQESVGTKAFRIDSKQSKCFKEKDMRDTKADRVFTVPGIFVAYTYRRADGSEKIFIRLNLPETHAGEKRVREGDLSCSPSAGGSAIRKQIDEMIGDGRNYPDSEEDKVAWLLNFLFSFECFPVYMQQLLVERVTVLYAQSYPETHTADALKEFPDEIHRMGPHILEEIPTEKGNPETSRSPFHINEKSCHKWLQNYAQRKHPVEPAPAPHPQGYFIYSDNLNSAETTNILEKTSRVVVDWKRITENSIGLPSDEKTNPELKSYEFRKKSWTPAHSAPWNTRRDFAGPNNDQGPLAKSNTQHAFMALFNNLQIELDEVVGEMISKIVIENCEEFLLDVDDHIDGVGGEIRAGSSMSVGMPVEVNYEFPNLRQEQEDCALNVYEQYSLSGNKTTKFINGANRRNYLLNDMPSFKRNAALGMVGNVDVEAFSNGDGAGSTGCLRCA
tara:strand:+ start:327 stop:1835 length:1509 start_codon:yes stop_codon:yes gene_type:complete